MLSLLAGYDDSTLLPVAETGATASLLVSDGAEGKSLDCSVAGTSLLFIGVPLCTHASKLLSPTETCLSLAAFHSNRCRVAELLCTYLI